MVNCKLDIQDIIEALQSSADANKVLIEIYHKALYSRDFSKEWVLDIIEDYNNRFD